jgi:hypothetical protein
LAWLMAWLKRKYSGAQKERDTAVQSKGKLIGVNVWLMTHKGKGKQGNNYCVIRWTKERIVVSLINS